MSEQGEATLAATMHPALVTAMSLVKGVEYLRLMGDDPYRFLPLAVAPIGTVGELVTGVGPGEWYNGPLVVVRPQGYNAPAPPVPVASPGARFDDGNLGTAIDRAIAAKPATSEDLRVALFAAAAIAHELGVNEDTFRTCAEVAFVQARKR